MKDKLIYWITTGITGAMMLFSGYAYFANPEVMAGFTHLGFPDYFRMELGLAKAVGALILLIPQIPGKVKEWAYAGFGITFISAIIAHLSSNDPVSVAIPPAIFLGILLVSRFYLERVSKPALN